MDSEDKIELSVVLRVVGGGEFLRRCLYHLMPQTKKRAIEVVVPYDSTVKGVAQLKPDFPEAIFIDIGVIAPETPLNSPSVAHILYDRRTTAGLKAARGEIVALLEDYGAPASNWCEQLLNAHKLLPHGVIGGAVEHAGQGALNWAVYFLDFGRYQLPLREGPADYLTDVNVSYKRAVLYSVGDLWAEKYNEVTVHWALLRQGVTLWRLPQLVVSQDRGHLSFLDLVVERYHWGRLFAATRTREISFISRLIYVIFSPLVPLALLGRMARKVLRGQHHRSQFLLSFPMIVAMTLSWCFGEFVGYLTGRTSHS